MAELTLSAGDIASALTADEIATLATIPNRALILVRRTEVANAVRDALRAICIAAIRCGARSQMSREKLTGKRVR